MHPSQILTKYGAACFALTLFMACGGGSGDDPSQVVAPSITAQPASLTISEGQTATFTVTATGTAPLHYQWKKDGSATGTDSATHTTAATLSEDGAVFTVIVSNTAGSVTSSGAVLRVNAVDTAPEISYSAAYTFTAGTAIAAIVPTNTGGAASSWSIHPTALPAGLLFNASNGQITGTPSDVFSTTAFTVTATNGVGSDASVFSLTVSAAPTGSQIIADHNAVTDFSKIPSQYLAEVKKMMVFFPGESHSAAYRDGLEMLETSSSTHACNVASGEAPTTAHLRANSGISVGEAIWFTWYAYDDHGGSNKDVIKNLIKEYNDHGHPMHAIGFGWCWDLTRGSASTTADPTLGVRWYGSTEGGPDGDRMWGLNAADFAQTANRVSMDTYLGATEDYRLHAISIGAPTKVVFTTGPADLSGESGYQGHLKHEYMRDYVKANADRILFDYADILAHSDAGETGTTTWSGHTYPTIHASNNGDDTGHIATAGAIRLAKAQWWMLARIAGWDGK